MNAEPLHTRFGTGLSRAGEWIHYVAASWLLFGRGGTAAVAAYLVAVSLPGFLAHRRRRAGALAAPAALACLAIFSDGAGVGFLIALGALAGFGAAFAGRPVAWTAGIHGTCGMMGAAGAAAGMILVASGRGRLGLWAAAALLVAAFFLGERHVTRGERPALMQPATLGLAFLVGVRVLETGFFERPAAAGLFATAWAFGLDLGWRAAPRADARLVLGTPFLIAGALAVMSGLEGPAMLLLYGGVGCGVGLVGGAGMPAPDRSRTAGGFRYLLAAIAGAIWASRSPDFSSTLWVASAVALVTGFLSSHSARRIRVPGRQEAPVATEPLVNLSEPVSVEALAVPPLAREVIDPLDEAAEELAAAIATARVIRREAIAAFSSSVAAAQAGPSGRHPATVEEAKRRIQWVLGGLDQNLARTSARLRN